MAPASLNTTMWAKETRRDKKIIIVNFCY
jgi:hypothetical protein